MAEAIAAKNSEIEALVSSAEALKKQAALSEENLASLQANMETLMRNRELSETRMMQKNSMQMNRALKEEFALAERRAEEERAAHNATKKAAMEREVELEHRAVDASTGLARLQCYSHASWHHGSGVALWQAPVEISCSKTIRTSKLLLKVRFCLGLHGSCPKIS